MKIFILVTFGLYIASTIMKIGELASKDFPYKESVSEGKVIAKIIVNIAFIFWAGIVLWG